MSKVQDPFDRHSIGHKRRSEATISQVIGSEIRVKGSCDAHHVRWRHGAEQGQRLGAASVGRITRIASRRCHRLGRPSRHQWAVRRASWGSLHRWERFTWLGFSSPAPRRNGKCNAPSAAVVTLLEALDTMASLGLSLALLRCNRRYESRCHGVSWYDQVAD
jgi:hypothetical protein